MKIPKTLKTIAQKIFEAGGTPVLVGGAIRDDILGIECKDLDVEVFGLSKSKLIAILREFGKVSQVGRTFGILKLTVDNEDFDFSLPRSDQKTGSGHKGFFIKTDPYMSFEQAASRRDFTINSMGFNILNDEIIDEYNGIIDLKNRELRVVNREKFVEDPLRVLRGIQFAARFCLTITETTLEIFKTLVSTLHELPDERVFEEFKKLLLKADKPSVGFAMAAQVGVIQALYPEMKVSADESDEKVKQEKHPNWTLMLGALDEAAGLRCDEIFKDLCLMLTIICLDFARPDLEEKSGKESGKTGKAKSKLKSVRMFLGKLTKEIDLVNTVESLVREIHQPDLIFANTENRDGEIRRLSLRVNVSLLIKAARAEHFGRQNESDVRQPYLAGDWMIKRFKELGLSDSKKIEPLLMGRHLIEMGLKPGPKFTVILKEAFEKQLDGVIRTLDEILEWAHDRVQ